MVQIILSAIILFLYLIIIFLKSKDIEIKNIWYFLIIGLLNIGFLSLFIFNAYSFYLPNFKNNFKVANFTQLITINNQFQPASYFIFYILDKNYKWKIAYPDFQFEYNLLAYSPYKKVETNSLKTFKFNIDFTKSRKIYIQQLKKGSKFNNTSNIARSFNLPDYNIYLYSKDFSKRISGISIDFTFELTMLFLHFILMIILIYHILQGADNLFLKLTKYIIFPLLLIINGYFLYNFGKIFYFYLFSFL